MFGGLKVDSLHLHPAPVAMFLSCIGLGCCVSSFMYRHQRDDPYQPLIFASSIVGSIVAGHVVVVSPYLITLAYVPWALCMAMFLSVCGHALMRRLKARKDWDSAGQVFNDKTALLPKHRCHYK